MSDAANLRAQLGALLASGRDATEMSDEYGKLLVQLKESEPALRPDDPLIVIAGLLFPSAARMLQSKPKDAGDDKSVIIEWDYLEKFMRDALMAVGIPEEQATVGGKVLIGADKRGLFSHGLNRLKPIYLDRIRDGIFNPVTELKIVHESQTTAVVDGGLGFGLYIGPKCMEIAIKKAKEFGMGFVAVRNSTHYGFAGYYVLQACEAKCIGMTGTNARPSIAPTFGVDPLLGTNPLVIGIPTDDEFPFVLDAALSITQRGRIEAYAREGKPTPPGQVVDRQGRIRTDSEGILRDLLTGQCALAPLGGTGTEMGGYKGYGLATAIEILCSALQDNPWGPELKGVDENGKKIPMPLGHFFLAIDTERFTTAEEFQRRAGKVTKGLRHSTPEPGRTRILTSGELEYDTEKRQTEQGGLKVGKILQDEMIAIREEYKMQGYDKLPFE